MSERNIAQKTRWLSPRSTVRESKDGKLRVVLEMPGVRKEDIDVRIENNELSIVGRRPAAAEGKHILRERPVGEYRQVYTLDDTVDHARIDAVMEKGILTITLDLKEHVKPRTIQIRGE
jgi:HSP20 family protein